MRGAAGSSNARSLVGEESSLMASPLSWYVARTRPRQEVVAEHNLRQLGLETLLPLLRQDEARTTMARRRPRVAAPLFPGYLFVRFDVERHLRAVSFARGVRHLLTLGGGLAVVPTDVVEAIVRRLEDGVVVLRPSWRPGDRVRLGPGPLEGLEAIFERELTDQQRVVVLLRCLTYEARVIVDLAQVVNG